MGMIVNPYKFATGGDPYFANVVLLCGYEGSTVGKDDSLANRTPGGAPANAAGGKFGSSLQQGGTNILSYADSSDFFFASSPFTIDTWVNFTTAPTTPSHFLMGQYDTGANQRSWALWVNSGTLELLLSSAGTSGTARASSAWAPSTGIWYHLAADFDGTNYRTYVNGAMLGKSSGTIALFNSTAALSVGSALNSGVINTAFRGFLDETRITKGVARYASDSGFTVPTAVYPRS